MAMTNEMIIMNREDSSLPLFTGLRWKELTLKRWKKTAKSGKTQLKSLTTTFQNSNANPCYSGSRG